MRNTFFLIICAFFVMPLQAEEADTSVIFKADFLKHEMQQYVVSLSNYALKNGDTTALETLQTKVDIFISDSTGSQYIITWKFHDFSVNTNSKQIKDIVNLAKPVDITVRTSRQGIISDFVSWEEASTCLDEGVKVVLERYATRKDSVANVDVNRIFAFRESLESMMLRSIRSFYQLYGLGYDLNKVIDVPTEIYGLVASEPVLGITRKKLTGIDRKAGVAILSTATFPDRKSLKEIYSKNYPGLSIPSSLMNQTIMGGVMSDLNTGWILYSFEQREESYDSAAKGEMLEIKHSEFNQ